MKWLGNYINKTAKSVNERLSGLIKSGKISLLEREKLEEALLMADIGPRTACEIVNRICHDIKKDDASLEEIQEAFANSLTNMLLNAINDCEKPTLELFDAFYHSPDNPLHVIVLLGVNGSGKTTTAAKIAHILKNDKQQSVTIAACDTFRAAAVEQLQAWAEKLKIKIVSAKKSSDSSSVAFEAVKIAREENSNFLIIDTAGRLHNNQNLMSELEKIIRVVKKQAPDSIVSRILVLDGTTGQNAINQVREFQKNIGLESIIVTKLDGTAKAGIIVSLIRDFKIPVTAIGNGENLNSLIPFDIKEFSKALVGLNQDAKSITMKEDGYV